MVVINCTKDDCDWKTEDREPSMAMVLAAELQNHTSVSYTHLTLPPNREV